MFSVHPVTETNITNVILILFSVLLLLIFIAVIIILLSLSGCAVKRHLHKKEYHLYDFLNNYQLPPLPPPRTIQSVKATESPKHRQQAEHVYPTAAPNSTNGPETDEVGEDVVNEAYSDLPVQMSICNELDDLSEEDNVTCCTPLQANDAYGLDLADSQSPCQIPCAHQTSGDLDLPDLLQTDLHSSSDLSSERHSYERVWGYERIEHCDIGHFKLGNGHNCNSKKLAVHNGASQSLPSPSCREQDLEFSSSKHNSYERIWGYERIHHCDLPLEYVLKVTEGCSECF